MSLRKWQESVIYFILIDRFYNGDRSNDDFGKGEYDPGSDDCFHGGDLKGIRLKLPFIKAMGYDAIWITPPVHNQWINPYINTRGFHGYWAYDFTAIDPHFGTLEDYKALVEDAHRLGIKVIQDIVVNHTGNFFSVDAKDYDPARPELNWKAAEGAYPPEGPVKAPKDPVFRLNDPRVPEHKAARVYNFTPNITDFNDREQTLTWSMGDLDDVNLKSPLAVARMKEIYRYWIDEAGVDGFRVDTVFYTPEEFYDHFLHDESKTSPGVKTHARAKGREDFFVFGEAWSYDYKAINRYLEGPSGPRLDSALDLPLNEALTQVFFRKAATERLRGPLAARRVNRRLWVNFLDNHDVERMASRAAWPAVQQALVALFTLPGIPCLTWGTEAGFTATRQDMFLDALFDENQERAVFLRRLIAFRKAHPAFSQGTLRLESASPAAGLLSWSLSHGGEKYRVVFNTASDAVFCGLDGRYETLLSSGVRKTAGDWVILPPESYLVMRLEKAAGTRKPSAARIKPLRRRSCQGTVPVAFSLKSPERVAELSMLANDDYARRMRIRSPRRGVFDLDTAALGNGKHRLSLLAKTKAGALIPSDPVEIFVRNPYVELARATVPPANKNGLGNRLQVPGDPSYNGQVSMQEAAVYTSGRDIRLELRMDRVTKEWNPPHGFDHVYFNVFFDFPGIPGKRFFPKLDYAREDFEFNAGFLLYGWGARSFGAADSTPQGYGAPLVGDVSMEADADDRTVAFTFSSSYFKGLKTFDRMKVFIGTWDGYLGELRSIADKKEDWNFYRLDAASGPGPKVFDHLIIKV